MKKLFTFKNLLGVIFIIVLIIVPLVTKDKETINIFYFFIGIIFIAMFYRTKDDSNTFLIYLFEKKERSIEINQKALKIMSRDNDKLTKENDQLKNVDNASLREELKRLTAEKLELKKLLEDRIDNDQLELAKEYLKNRSVSPMTEHLEFLKQLPSRVVPFSDVAGVLDLMKNGEFLGFYAKFKEEGHPYFQ